MGIRTLGEGEGMGDREDMWRKRRVQVEGRSTGRERLASTHNPLLSNSLFHLIPFNSPLLSISSFFLSLPSLSSLSSPLPVFLNLPFFLIFLSSLVPDLPSPHSLHSSPSSSSASSSCNNTCSTSCRPLVSNLRWISEAHPLPGIPRAN